MIVIALRRQPCRCNGDGTDKSRWLYVQKTLQAPSPHVLSRGKVGEIYTTSALDEKPTRNVHTGCPLLDELAPKPDVAAYSTANQAVKDARHRPPYASTPAKLNGELGGACRTLRPGSAKPLPVVTGQQSGWPNVQSVAYLGRGCKPSTHALKSFPRLKMASRLGAAERSLASRLEGMVGARLRRQHRVCGRTSPPAAWLETCAPVRPDVSHGRAIRVT